MKFPDYSRCVEINQLLIAMGVTKIPLLPGVRFEREIVNQIERVSIDQVEIEITERLIDSAIPVRKSEIVGRFGQLLEYKGRKVCAYIRDQRAAINFYQHRSEYRYHLVNCETLTSMKDYGREGRYLATQRKDGLFEAHDLTVNPPQKGIVQMDLCQNCVKILIRMKKYFNPFNLITYFEKNDTYIPKTIRKIEEVRKIQTYSPKQDDYSREYRKACNYKCQICNVDCSDSTGLLHLHHINADPSNNRRDNLQIYCVDCHSKQPLHAHMKSNPQFQRQIEKIKELRKEQGILTVS